ncbi:hypothetical protein PLICRDRAFT_46649 [Plicaturopsis crispa FD-325 SS-3]|uniref:Uncharacterized protein n=1 Tax=Plicaturopsis crispa FD-325 SS-3 TaxID=944288 RepID=A0A0C9SWS2_PLICR|nr:hypothetical protein PLICRDRAFT_46649 [Plicaturopsis crispa FD-325 SS-3]
MHKPASSLVVPLTGRKTNLAPPPRLIDYFPVVPTHPSPAHSTYYNPISTINNY